MSYLRTMDRFARIRRADHVVSGMANRLLIVWAAWSLVAGASSMAQESTRPAADSIEAFQLIYERNIFNPDRLAPRRGEPAPEVEREEGRPVETESLVLLGTISYDKGSYGFFDGSSSEYRGSFRARETIGGFLLTHVGPKRVILEKDGQSLELSVGGELSKREGESAWKIMDRRSDFVQNERRSGSYGDRGGEDRAPSSRAADEKTKEEDGGGDEADILRRLMEKREQEMRNEN